MWELLRYLAGLSPDPWLCLGDFNEVMTMLKKCGGGAKSNTQLCNFQTTLEYCELTNLEYKGPKDTWTNCHDGHEFIKEKLDQGTVNSGWRELYPDAKIAVEVVTTSNHALLVLHLAGHRIEKSKTWRFHYKPVGLKNGVIRKLS